MIISDLTGALPWFSQHIPSVIDARRRLLAPGGVLIPQRDTAWAAIVTVGELYRRWTGPWNGAAANLDMAAARRIIVNTTTSVHLAGENLLTEPQHWEVIDYGTVEEANVRDRITWTVTQRGTGHGFAAGFDRTLADGIWMSECTGHSRRGPADNLSDAVLSMAVGRGARGRRSHHGTDRRDADGEDYTWTWRTHIADESGNHKTAFTQSTFFGMPLSPRTLRTRAASAVPSLNEDGRIARAVLEAMSEGVPLGEIARRIETAFAAPFSPPERCAELRGGAVEEYFAGRRPVGIRRRVARSRTRRAGGCFRSATMKSRCRLKRAVRRTIGINPSGTGQIEQLIDVRIGKPLRDSSQDQLPPKLGTNLITPRALIGGQPVGGQRVGGQGRQQRLGGKLGAEQAVVDAAAGRRLDESCRIPHRHDAIARRPGDRPERQHLVSGRAGF